jgi:myo-inositol 2-dehydrogenase/D-chiro-inositol 1-dehydrogenase
MRGCVRVQNVVGVGVVGVGAIGLRHVETLVARVPGVRIAAVYDPDPRRVELARTVAAGAAVTDGPRQLIARPDVDAVVVASPDAHHAAAVKACLSLGKPVLCEKPLATDLAECSEIVAIECAGTRRLVQVGFMRRFDAGYRQLKRTLAAGVLGAPVMVHAVHRNPEPPPAFTPSMVFTNSASHDLDIVCWLLDDTVVSVSVHTPRSGVIAQSGLSPARLVILTTRDGVVVTVELFLSAGYGYDVQCEVVGERGVARLGNSTSVVTAIDRTQRAELPTDWWDRFADAYAEELHGWIDGVRRGVVDGPSAWDGYLAQALADACWAAARTGVTQQISSPPAPPFYGGARPDSNA